jgi:broad specificity phosphatase PhoE
LTRVILIRHGQTSWNESRRIQGGNNDIELNQEGERQCHCLSERLKNEDIKAVYSSPMTRALRTARWIADDHHLEVIQESALREIDCGTMEGEEIREVGSRLQLLLKGGDEGELLFKGCGGESLDAIQTRSWNAILRMVENHPDGTIVAVSHYFVIAAVLCSVLNLPALQSGRFRMGETSINIINFDTYGPFLSLFNDRCHLTR